MGETLIKFSYLILSYLSAVVSKNEQQGGGGGGGGRRGSMIYNVIDDHQHPYSENVNFKISYP